MPVGSVPLGDSMKASEWLVSRLTRLRLVTERELADARKAAERRNIPLEEAFIALGLLTEDQVGMLKAEALDVPYVFPHVESIPRDLVALFPADVLRELPAIPLLREEGRIILATPDAVNSETKRRLEELCGSEVAFSLASARSVERVLAKLLPLGEKEEPAAPREPSAMNLLYGHLARALACGASEIRFEPQGQDIKVRYRVGGRMEDRAAEPVALLFPLVSRFRALFEGRWRSRPGCELGTLTTRIGPADVRLEGILLPTRSGESMRLKLSRERHAAGFDLARHLGKEAASVVSRVLALNRGAILAASTDADFVRSLCYGLLKKMRSSDRTVLTIEPTVWELEPGFRQLESGGIPFGEALAAALAYEPEIIYVGHPLQWPGEVAAVLMAATSRLVLISTSDPSPVDALTRWLESGAPAWLLARVLGPLLMVQGEEDVRIVEPSEGVRQALERRAPPEEIRALLLETKNR
ncbi:MAG: Flp pilus assembly complex ATPase component TadA [Planctomycetes bacterium]|nr:Flp pilus assembly complex ATPase component TadA [Planctomycetota bacterium]